MHRIPNFHQDSQIKLPIDLSSRPSTSQVAIGNRAPPSEYLNPNGLSHIDRGVLAHSGLTHALIFEGINDIGKVDCSLAAQKAIGDSLIKGYRQFIVRVHAPSLSAIGATITLFRGSFYDEATGERQSTRTRVTEWIQDGAFDDVVDFDQAVGFRGM